MPDPRFEFLDLPLHALQEHLKAELARNPFFAPVPARPDGEGRRQETGDGPPAPPAEDPEKPD